MTATARRWARSVRVAFVLAVLMGIAACTGRSDPLPPAEEGVRFGVSLDWTADAPSRLADRLGRHPEVYVAFAEFPLTDDVWGGLEAVAAQVLGQQAALLLTLEPLGGLATVTDDTATQVAERMAELNDGGIDVYLRFGHEMNGSWYPWSQQPAAYVEAFREVAAAVHARTAATAMLWSPNNGLGYPFEEGGDHGAVPGSADHRALDTDGDGRLTMADDPYAPYYPGDDAVDWVGLSVYHWGSRRPWGNEVPEPGAFERMITGDHPGTSGAALALPDFHERYHVEHGKPIAITETAALFIPGSGGADELAIKQAWWRQVFDPTLPDRLPGVAMINWFDWQKFEAEVDDVVDWSVSTDADIRQAFVADLPGWLR